MSKNEANVKVVKVRPYPIALLLTLAEGKPPVRAKILKLTSMGFITHLPDDVFLIAHSWIHIEFDVPASHETIKTEVQVIKVYDRHLSGQAREHLAELHFKKLSDKATKAIDNFCRRIGQN